MLLLRDSRFKVVPWPFHLVLTNLTSLALHHDLFELFVGLEDVAACIDSRVAIDLALRVKVVVVLVAGVLLALLRDGPIRSFFIAHHSGLLVVCVGVLLLTLLGFLLLSCG